MPERILLDVSPFNPYLLKDHSLLLKGAEKHFFDSVIFLILKDETDFEAKEKLISAALKGDFALPYRYLEAEDAEKGIRKAVEEAKGKEIYLEAPVLTKEEKDDLLRAFKGLKEYKDEEESLDKEEYLAREKEVREGRSFYLPFSEIQVLLEDKMYFVPQVLPYYKERRYQHCLRVGQVAFQIATMNKKDPYQAYLASYYHDITRAGAKTAYEKRAIEEEGKFFKNRQVPSWVLHQFTAPMLLSDEFHLQDHEV